MRLVDRARLEARWDHGNAFCGRGETCSWRRCGARSRVPQPPIALPGGQNTQRAGQPHHAEIILFIRTSDYHIERLSCPGRSAAPLRRCAAEPGPMRRHAARPPGSRLCAAPLRAASRPGHEAENAAAASARNDDGESECRGRAPSPTPPVSPPRTRADRHRIRASPGNDRFAQPSSAPGRICPTAAVARWDKPSAEAHGLP
ncbi:hypothetical protein ABIF20_003156 [Bradyrhizobium japonicum]